MPGDGLDRLQPGNDGVAVDLHGPGQSAAAASAQVAARGPTKGKCTADLAVEAVEQHQRARAVDPLDPGRDVDEPWRAAGSSAKATRRASRLTPPGSRRSGSSALTTATPPGTTWRNSLALARRSLQHDLGREPERRSDVGHDRGVEGDPVEATMRKRLAGDFEDAPLAAALDHLGQQGRQTGRAGAKAPGS